MKLPAVRSWVLLIVCVAIPIAVGIIGSVFTITEIPGWYSGLQKPFFTPPGWVFGPAWTILYILMGLSLYLIVKDGLRTAPVRQGVILFAAQLLLNFAWSWIFFGRHAILLGLIDVLLLFVLVAATIWVFLRISRPAALLLVPYLCWVGFASLLNAMIWVLN